MCFIRTSELICEFYRIMVSVMMWIFWALVACVQSSFLIFARARGQPTPFLWLLRCAAWMQIMPPIWVSPVSSMISHVYMIADICLQQCTEYHFLILWVQSTLIRYVTLENCSNVRIFFIHGEFVSHNRYSAIPPISVKNYQNFGIFYITSSKWIFFISDDVFRFQKKNDSAPVKIRWNPHYPSYLTCFRRNSRVVTELISPYEEQQTEHLPDLPKVGVDFVVRRVVLLTMPLCASLFSRKLRDSRPSQRVVFCLSALYSIFQLPLRDTFDFVQGNFHGFRYPGEVATIRPTHPYHEINHKVIFLGNFEDRHTKP